MSLDLLRRLIAPCEKACVGRDGLLACSLLDEGRGKRDFRGPIYIFLSPGDFPSKWSVTLIHLSSTIGRLVSLIVCKDRSNELTYLVSGKYFPVATDANSPHQYNSRESDKAQGLILP
eukprot:scaffold9398_cov138-Alexandrium_tamarense.AAC.1